MENTRKIKKAYFQRQLTGTQSAIGLLVLLPLYAIFGSRIATALMKLSMVLFDYRLTRTALSSYLNLVFGIMMLILLVLLLRGYLKDNWKDFMKNKRSIFIKGLMTFVLVYLANYIGTIVVMLMGGASNSANQAGIEQILSRVPVPMILYAVLVGPVVEELMFRGSMLLFFQAMSARSFRSSLISLPALSSVIVMSQATISLPQSSGIWAIT